MKELALAVNFVAFVFCISLAIDAAIRGMLGRTVALNLSLATINLFLFLTNLMM